MKPLFVGEDVIIEEIADHYRTLEGRLIPKSEQVTGYHVLDHGFVRLVDSMGSDASIVQAARVSYGKGTKTVSEDKKLVHYLMDHDHGTPFEMVEFKFHAKMPIFVARQWVRHRTASINEYSMRYSEAIDDYYVPTFRAQKGKQTSGDEIPVSSEGYVAAVECAIETYRELLKAGVARELARCVLPVSMYTMWYWKCNLRNLFHFLKLRLDAHAQYEIRVYAEAMLELIRPIVPICVEAWRQHGSRSKDV